MNQILRQGSQLLNPGEEKTLITYYVPRGMKFRMEEVGNYTNNSIAFGYITWKVRVNGFARYPLDSVLDQIGSQNQLVAVGEEIGAAGGDVVTVTAENASGAPSAFAAGWVFKGRIS